MNSAITRAQRSGVRARVRNRRQDPTMQTARTHDPTALPAASDMATIRVSLTFGGPPHQWPLGRNKALRSSDTASRAMAELRKASFGLPFSLDLSGCVSHFLRRCCVGSTVQRATMAPERDGEDQKAFSPSQSSPRRTRVPSGKSPTCLDRRSDLSSLGLSITITSTAALSTSTITEFHPVRARGPTSRLFSTRIVEHDRAGR